MYVDGEFVNIGSDDAVRLENLDALSDSPQVNVLIKRHRSLSITPAGSESAPDSNDGSEE